MPRAKAATCCRKGFLKRIEFALKFEVVKGIRNYTITDHPASTLTLILSLSLVSVSVSVSGLVHHPLPSKVEVAPGTWGSREEKPLNGFK